MIEPNGIYTVQQLAKLTPFGRGYLYNLIHSGELKAISQGTKGNGRSKRYAVRGSWFLDTIERLADVPVTPSDEWLEEQERLHPIRVIGGKS
jgi:excisionase family DNA binding protein